MNPGKFFDTEEFKDTLMVAIASGLHMYKYREDLKHISKEELIKRSIHYAEKKLKILLKSEQRDQLIRSALKGVDYLVSIQWELKK